MARAKKSTQRSLTARKTSPASASSADRLLGDIRSLIEAARERTAQAVNSALVGLYWHIGRRIREDVLNSQRAGYGEEILQTLSAKLVELYGRGFGARKLANMIRFAETFPEEPPLGLILYADKSEEHVELLQLDRTGIRVAHYLAELPPQKLLERDRQRHRRRSYS